MWSMRAASWGSCVLIPHLCRLCSLRGLNSSKAGVLAVAASSIGRRGSGVNDSERLTTPVEYTVPSSRPKKRII